MAVRFDAATDRYTASTGLPTGNTWTVTSWIYISVDRNAYSTWLSIDDANASGTRRFAFLNTIANGTSLAFDTQGSEVGAYAGAVGNWYRYGVAIENGAVRLYIGAATGALSLYTGTPGNFPTAPVRLWIGNEPIFGDFFNGRVAAVKIWNAALSAAEVEAELAQYAPVRSADLLRYHPFIDSPVDLSGNGHTLTAGSTPVAWEPGPDIPEGGDPEPVVIDVAGARSVSYATRPLLVQNAPALHVDDVRASTHVTRPLLGVPFSRPYFQAADWLWDQIPATPLLDPDSAAIAGALAQGQHVANTVDFSVALAGPDGITASTPRYDVFFVNQTGNGGDNWGSDPFGSQTMPIPPGLVVPGEYADWQDGHVAVADPTTNTTFNLWQAEDLGTSWRASWGAMAPFDGDGREYTYSSTGAGLARYACVIRVDEIAAGKINHALFFSTDIARLTEFRYPATKTDGSNGAGSPVTIPEGARVQLDPTIDLEAIPGITPAEITIGRALQQYGAYCGDNGGARMAFIFERATDTDDANGVPGQVYQDAGLGWDYIDMSHIPWGSLRTLATWDGAGATTPITVRSSRAATRATATALEQQHTVTVLDARTTSSAGVVQVGQTHPLQVADAAATSRAGWPELNQTHPVIAAAARAATRATTPTLTQHAVLDVAAARAATTTTAVDLTAPLLVDGARATTAAPRPVLGHTSPVTADDAQAATTAGSVELDQRSVLTVTEARAATTTDRPLLVGDADLVVHEARATTTATGPLLAAPTILGVHPTRAATRTATVLLEQTHPPLQTRDARAATTATTATITGPDTLVIHASRATTHASRGALAQQSTVAVLDTHATTTAQRVLLALTATADPAAVPASVQVTPMVATVRTHPTVGRVDHTSAAVTVHVR